MKTLRQPLIIIICVICSFQSLAQVRTDSTSNGETNAQAFLRLGVQLPLRNRNIDQRYKFNISYEHVISPRITASATLTSHHSFGQGFLPDLVRKTDDSFRFHDVRVGLDLDIKYYLKRNKFSGHYFSAEVQNVLALTKSSGATFIDSANMDSKNSINSLPRIGLYYGYRYQFKNGFFLDGKIGYVLNNQSNLQPFFFEKDTDVKLSIGYTIPFSKKKRKKRNK